MILPVIIRCSLSFFFTKWPTKLFLRSAIDFNGIRFVFTSWNNSSYFWNSSPRVCYSDVFDMVQDSVPYIKICYTAIHFFFKISDSFLLVDIFFNVWNVLLSKPILLFISWSHPESEITKLLDLLNRVLTNLKIFLQICFVFWHHQASCFLAVDF